MKKEMPMKKKAMPMKDSDMGIMGKGGHMMAEQHDAMHGKPVVKAPVKKRAKGKK